MIGCVVLAACGSDSNGGPDGNTTPPAACEALTITGTAVYVAVDGDDDSGDGSQGSPWASIGHAIQNVADETTIVVGPGTYNGRIRLDEVFDIGVRIVADPPYQARLRHTGTVVTVYSGKGITLEGFDIAHAGPGAEALVVQIQDLIGESGGDDAVSRITLRNNILHDSYNNDILKINNGVKDITIERNIFYNQEGSDEHIDINSVADVMIRDNIFFNDFAASGRTNGSDTSSYIVIKDSNGNDDSYEGTQRVTIRRNVFMNWQGGSGSNMVLVGEDGNSYYEARDILIENNLLVGNGTDEMRAPLGVKGGRDITIRHNTVVGDMPGNAFAFRFNQEGANPVNTNIDIYNNIWSDPTGSMDDFSDTPAGETSNFTLDNNLYWNNGQSLPGGGDDVVQVGDDAMSVEGDPLLPVISATTMPTWDESGNRFADGSGDTCAVFDKLIMTYAVLGAGSPAIGSARSDESPADDILGNPRSGATSIGAFEPQ